MANCNNRRRSGSSTTTTQTTAPAFDRPPINTTCATPAPAAAPTPYEPCAMLLQLRQAFAEAVAGKAVIEVRDGDRSIRYMNNAQSLAQLRLEISRLEAQCPQNKISNLYGPPDPRHRAVRLGPTHSHWPWNYPSRYR